MPRSRKRYHSTCRTGRVTHGIDSQRAGGAKVEWKKDPRFPKRFTARDEGGTPIPTLEEIALGMAAIREANAVAMLERRKPECEGEEEAEDD